MKKKATSCTPAEKASPESACKSPVSPLSFDRLNALVLQQPIRGSFNAAQGLEHAMTGGLDDEGSARESATTRGIMEF
jgi:hypothetical protein